MVRADKFSEEMSKLLAEYGEQVTEAMKEVVPTVAKKATEEVRSHAPTGHRGKYKKAIESKKAHETNTSIKYVIHAGDQAGLSHLLENGHAKVNGKGRTKSIPHFKYGEAYAKENLIPEIVKKIGG